MVAPSAARPGPHRDRPHLEQLGRRTLHHGVAAVATPAAARLRASRSLRARIELVGRSPRRPPLRGPIPADPPAAVGAQVLSPLAGPVAGVEVGHRHRIGRSRPRRARAPWPVVWPYMAPEHGDLGRRPVDAELGRHRGVEVVADRRRGERRVTGHGGQHPGLDLAEVGPDEHVPGLGDHRPASPPACCGARPTPSSARRRRPRPSTCPEATVGAEVLVEPPVAVGRPDALGLAPGQQGSTIGWTSPERTRVARPGCRGRRCRHPAAGP